MRGFSRHIFIDFHLLDPMNDGERLGCGASNDNPDDDLIDYADDDIGGTDDDRSARNGSPNGMCYCFLFS